MSRRRGSRDHPPPTVAAGVVCDYGQTAPARAPSTTVLCVLCRAWFVDDRDGHQAHRVVFGHTPRQRQALEGGGP